MSQLTVYCHWGLSVLTFRIKASRWLRNKPFVLWTPDLFVSRTACVDSFIVEATLTSKQLGFRLEFVCHSSPVVQTLANSQHLTRLLSEDVDRE